MAIDLESDDVSAALTQSVKSLVVACKRRITELEKELLDTKSRFAKAKKSDNPMAVMGRCIRRLVSLVDRVEDLVGEADRRACIDRSETSAPTEAEDRLYAAYKELIRWQPSLRAVFNAQEDIHALSVVFKELNRGADSARGDDAAGLKSATILWLMSARPAPDPPLHSSSKVGRGFNHDVTGRLLCPVDYNWDDLMHCARIRDRHPDFRVTAYSWPAFLYENEKYDPNSPTNGFLRNRLLVKAFKHVFTSPTSAIKMDESVPESPKRPKREGNRTRSHVAALLGMKAVCPRAIAYIAMQLHFALSDCDSWQIKHSGFNYVQFYHNIVTFFESAEKSEDTKSNSELLAWWNRLIFADDDGVGLSPQEHDKMSVARSLPQRDQQSSSVSQP